MSSAQDRTGDNEGGSMSRGSRLTNTPVSNSIPSARKGGSSGHARVIPLRDRQTDSVNPADVPEQSGYSVDSRGQNSLGTKKFGDIESNRDNQDSFPALASFLRSRFTGEYTVDEFGFDAELTENVVLPLLRKIYRNWFRVETHGIENLPFAGGALIVCNHSGTLPLDALMTAVAVHDQHPRGRHLRGLGADLLFQLPIIGSLARKTGQTLACNADAERLLRGNESQEGQLVGVWPEGFKGIGKPFSSRYKLQRFGRGGFVSAALRSRVPIIPCSIVGAEEIYPKIGDIKPLAKLLGLPYVPVTPFFPLLGPLGAIPLPTKWHIEFGEPIRTDDFPPEDVEDPMLVFTLTDMVRESIQQSLYRRLAIRRGVFRG